MHYHRFLLTNDMKQIRNHYYNIATAGAATAALSTGIGNGMPGA